MHGNILPPSASMVMRNRLDCDIHNTCTERRSIVRIYSVGILRRTDIREGIPAACYQTGKSFKSHY